MKKKLLCALVACSVFTAVLPESVSFAAIIAQNSQWDGIEWTLDDSGLLVINGSGDMQDFLTWHKNHYREGFIAPWLGGHNEDIKSVVIQDGITSIGSWAFRGCKNLTSIQIPDSVTKIGEYAFDTCENLTSVHLPDSVTEIGTGAFYECKNLADVNVPKNLTKIGKDAFISCEKITSLPLPETILPVQAAESNNRNANAYNAFSAFPVKSYLYSEGDNLIRVECIGGQIIVEKYSSDFKLLSSRRLASDLAQPWGGFFAGKDYNFVIVGKKNKAENNRADVVTVIKYDKDWNRLGQAVLRGANTIEPFSFGSLRCAEYNGMLYVHTCHVMFKTPDGLNHQANMMFAVRENDMSITDSQYEVTYKYGYVSHSLNQFILIDQNRNILTLDQGDGYPRAAILQKYSKKAGNSSFAEQPSKVEIRKFPENNQMYQKTGVCLGGLVETTNDYLTVYSDDENGGKDDNRAKNIFVSALSKKVFSERGNRVVKVTNYEANGEYSAGTPVIVPINLDSGFILWDLQRKDESGSYSSSGNLICVKYSADGQISAGTELDGMISDCQPINFQGKIVWYVTEDSSPVFYTLDSSGISEHRAE